MPCQKLINVFVAMNAPQMIFEVVFTRPDLLLVLAMIRRAPPAIVVATNLVHALHVPITVVGGPETLVARASGVLAQMTFLILNVACSGRSSWFSLDYLTTLAVL